MAWPVESVEMLSLRVIIVALIFVLTASAAYSRRVLSKSHRLDAEFANGRVVVDQSGRGNFTTIQSAIDWVPSSNNQWICIHVKPGIYNEKVVVGKERQYILLEGENSRTTIIQYNGHGPSMDAVTFMLYADNFVATNISFTNYYSNSAGAGDGDLRAPAIAIAGDRVSFYNCQFISLQDTIFDWQGRHYFSECYIEGAVDFIWGYGQSQYMSCIITSRATALGTGSVGFITAQGRGSWRDSGGFVFKYCLIQGDGSTYLGRAYGQYSRVVFYKTHMSNVVVPLGWQAWNYVRQESKFTYVESECSGPGSDLSGRVRWMMNLNSAELSQLVDRERFINQERWIESQPI